MESYDIVYPEGIDKFKPLLKSVEDWVNKVLGNPPDKVRREVKAISFHIITTVDGGVTFYADVIVKEKFYDWERKKECKVYAQRVVCYDL